MPPTWTKLGEADNIEKGANGASAAGGADSDIIVPLKNPPPARDALDEFVDKLNPVDPERQRRKMSSRGVMNPPTLIWTLLPNNGITTIVPSPGNEALLVASKAFYDRAMERIGYWDTAISLSYHQVNPSDGEFYQYTLFISRNTGSGSWMKIDDDPIIRIN